MPKETYNKAVSILEAFIKEHNMRQTIERKTVLKQVCSYNRAFTAEEVIEAIQEQQFMSVATVYNALDLFEKCAIICKVEPFPGNPQAVYERMRFRGNQLSFVCINCGRIEPFKDKALDDFLRAKKFSNFTMENFSLRVYGHCKRCRRKPISNR